MITINLLPMKVRKTKVALQLYTYLMIGGSVLAVVLVLVLLNLAAQTRRVEIKIAEVRKEAEALSGKIGPLRNLTGQEKEVADLQALTRKLAASQALWPRLLDELVNRVQDDMWLTRLTSRRSKSGPELLLTLEGEGYHKLPVADFMTALEQSRNFRNIVLGNLNEVKSADNSLVQFTLHLEYAAAPGARP